MPKQSLESLGASLSLTPEQLERMIGSDFLEIDPEKRRSSVVKLSATHGEFSKTKFRRPAKAIYEFLSLAIWHDLLNEYSGCNDVQFRAPMPRGLVNLSDDSGELIMEFLSGYSLKGLSTLRRTTPVSIRGQSVPLPLYAAVSLHLGALNKLKEEEGLYHNDFDSRHVLFDPVCDVAIKVIDVENSRQEEAELVGRESKKILEEFHAHTQSERDLEALGSWYETGANGLIIPVGGPRLPSIVQQVSDRYNVDIDFRNMVVGGHRIPLNSKLKDSQ